MADQVLRFSVGAADGNRAASWRVWSPSGRGKSDVYLACRSLGGALKTSLHESGSWHVGFIRDYVEANLDEADPKYADPYLQRWPRPAEIAPGVTLAYRILVMSSAVTGSGSNVGNTPMSWIPAPPAGMAVEITVLLTTAEATGRSWPGRDSMGTELVGSYLLDNGETVWVVHRAIDAPAIDLPATGRTAFFNGKCADDLNGPDVRALVFGDAADGSRGFVDCAVRGPSAAI
ncbi:MAG: hypothetical protein RBS78_08120 [Coriobacteriia bacterium]|jgi:hypothetical protein|nr:hypothetical protein [Coriobacteriia bacterium]